MGLNPPRLGDPRKVLEVVLGCAPEDVAEDIVVTPFLPLGTFRRLVDEGTVRDLSPPFFFQGFTAKYKKKPVTVIRTGVGPSRVGDCLSVLSLTPARRVLFAGAVGALHREWRIGEFFLPTEAADGEGFTRYVLKPFEDVIDNAGRVCCRGGLEGALAAFLRSRGETVREGRVFTIGSIAFEAQENLNLLAQHGYDAIEMELSAFFAAARHHGFDSAALTYVSDLPLGSSLWEEKTPQEEDALRRAFRLTPALCLDFMADVG
jgi:purine-nucleoside phosphorylase